MRRVGELTISEVAQASGCPWTEFLESYVKQRNTAVNYWTYIDGGHFSKGMIRKELVKAVCKGSDGMDQIFNHIVLRIQQNDGLLFQVLLLVLNGITVVGQFAWGEIRPHLEADGYQI